MTKPTTLSAEAPSEPVAELHVRVSDQDIHKLAFLALFWTILVVLFWVILFGLLMGLAWSEASHPWIGYLLGAAIGIVMGAVFSGAIGPDSAIANSLQGGKRSKGEEAGSGD